MVDREFRSCKVSKVEFIIDSAQYLTSVQDQFLDDFPFFIVDYLHKFVTF